MPTKAEKVTKKKALTETKAEVKAPLILYVLMFKIEGHETYRVNMFKEKADLQRYLDNQPNHPKITEKKWFIADKLKATIIAE